MDTKISNDNLIPKEITQFDNSKLSTREEVSVSQMGGDLDLKTTLSIATYDSGYLIYYIFFLAPLTFRLFKSEKIRLALIYIFLFFLTVFTGLRYEIGGDWLTYHSNGLDFFRSNFTYISLLNSRDFLWDASTYFSLYVGGGLILHNYLMALIFYICLHQYIKKFPFYEIALIISFPIFTLFLQMGFARQAMGVAFGLLAINALINKKTGKYILWIIIGSLFHKSTLFYLILYLIKIDFRNINRIKVFNTKLLIPLLLLVITCFFYFVYEDYINRLFYFYIGSQELVGESQGSIYRTGLNLVSGMVYLLLIFRKIENNEERKIYYILSLTAIFFFILQFNLSTFADRLSFYVTPLQLFTWCHLLKFIKDKKIQNISLFSILSVYLLLIVVWLNFGAARYSFIPYSNFIIDNCKRSDPYPAEFRADSTKDKWSNYRIYTNLCNPLEMRNRYIKRTGGLKEVKKLKWFNKLRYYSPKNVGSNENSYIKEN